MLTQPGCIGLKLVHPAMQTACNRAALHAGDLVSTGNGTCTRRTAGGSHAVVPILALERDAELQSAQSYTYTNSVFRGTDESRSEASASSNSAAEGAAGLPSLNQLSGCCLDRTQEQRGSCLHLDITSIEVDTKVDAVFLGALQSTPDASSASGAPSATSQPIASIITRAMQRSLPGLMDMVSSRRLQADGFSGVARQRADSQRPQSSLMWLITRSAGATSQHARRAAARAVLQRMQNRAAMQQLRREEGKVRIAVWL
jgi:hypothetical protein